MVLNMLKNRKWDRHKKGGLNFTIDMPYVYTDTNGKVAEYTSIIDVNAFNNKAQKHEEDKFAEFM